MTDIDLCQVPAKRDEDFIIGNDSLKTIAPPQRALLYPPWNRMRSSVDPTPRNLESRPLKTILQRSSKRSSKMFNTLWVSKRSRIKDNRDSRLIKKRLERYPEGYPRIAAYIDSDVDTVLFRRFGVLHARILLYKQAELTELEAQLDKLDIEDAGEKGVTPNRWRLGHSISLNNGHMNEQRKTLMEEIDKKQEAYDKLLLREAALRRLARPSTRVHHNFMDFIYTEHPFSDADERFIYHEHDFVTLEAHEESWLDELMHRLMGHCKKGIFKVLFVSPTDQAKTEEPHVHYYSEERLGAFIKVIIASASTTLLLIPMYLFLTLNLSSKMMALITLFFAFFFATAISVFTSARRQEVFGATAAYCAVLVVFIGNLQQRQWGQLSAPSTNIN